MSPPPQRSGSITCSASPTICPMWPVARRSRRARCCTTGVLRHQGRHLSKEQRRSGDWRPECWLESRSSEKDLAAISSSGMSTLVVPDSHVTICPTLDARSLTRACSIRSVPRPTMDRVHQRRAPAPGRAEPGRRPCSRATLHSRHISRKTSRCFLERTQFGSTAQDRTGPSIVIFRKPPGFVGSPVDARPHQRLMFLPHIALPPPRRIRQVSKSGRPRVESSTDLKRP